MNRRGFLHVGVPFAGLARLVTLPPPTEAPTPVGATPVGATPSPRHSPEWIEWASYGSEGWQFGRCEKR